MIYDWRFTIYELKVSGLRRYNHKCMLTADGEAGDTPLRFFTQNTMPLCRSGHMRIYDFGFKIYEF